MREKTKDENYWRVQVNSKKEEVIQRWEKLIHNEIADDRIKIVKRAMVFSYLESIMAKYSAGYPISSELNNDLLRAIDLCHESWDGFWKLNYKGKNLNQYILGA